MISYCLSSLVPEAILKPHRDKGKVVIGDGDSEITWTPRVSLEEA
jgi:hypothetical protein